ncbi:transposase, partial [Kingella kingae]|uniref:transposase n=1 Tax=Kingella kingae TaxID=504 RepID=UPI003BAF4915
RDSPKYFCKDCCRNFIGDHNLTYKGCHSKADEQVWRMTVRGCGIRDIAAITGYSKDKVQAALDLRRRWGMLWC